ncbi:MAG: SDR family oxidoreductase [Candidatus Dormibacteraeota bacterium]|uniref:SDR family oxidoreductase n=1 Tax=Candidatus Nephthysia bennettiae TaxID=3127016 RepID=A0A934NFD1_9BACT|nr:SDR family oxidoreductase [Candidatus Dormibacteraeota bacterium]
MADVPQQMDATRSEASRLGGDALELDASDPESSLVCVESVVKRLGRLDILVNNAGVAVRKPALELTPHDWDHVFSVNLRGAFFLAQAAGRVMVSQKSGRVVNVASIFGVVGAGDRAAYASSKAGLVNLTRCLAIEWAPFNVQVNAVAPNFASTPLTEQLLADAHTREWIIGRTPAGRLARPDEVSRMIAFLAGTAPDFLTGVTVPVDGGWLAS